VIEYALCLVVSLACTEPLTFSTFSRSAIEYLMPKVGINKPQHVPRGYRQAACDVAWISFGMRQPKTPGAHPTSLTIYYDDGSLSFKCNWPE